MTYEEIAEKYIKQDGTNGEKVWEKINKEFPNSFIVNTKKSKTRLAELLCEYTRVVFIDGLAEGERIGKEKQWIATEKAQKKTSEKIRKLEKENKISEEIIIGEQQEINRLEKEIKQIIERERVVPEHYLCEMIEKNKELKAQIEKMKFFIHSNIDFCTYCPLTNECRNDEGTCPYAYATEEEQKNLLMDFIKIGS